MNSEELQNLEKVLNFPYVASSGNAIIPDRNSKTVTKAVVQGGILHTSTSLKPTRQRSELEKLEAILNFPNV